MTNSLAPDSVSARSRDSKKAVPPARHPIRRDVQGLRALAVVAVILNHLLGWPAGGFIGVDVFFVLSGYLITGLLLREHDRSGTISFTGFYRRRVKRILPAAVLVLAATVAASYFLTPGARFLRTAADSFWALLFSANWNLALQGTDYFQQDLLPSPVQHYWSLAVEEQFYFVWPWLMLGILALGVRLFGWTAGRRRVAVGVAIGIISIASFVYAIYLTGSDQNWAYFSSLDRAWELGAGALVAVFGVYFRTKNMAVRTAMSWLGFSTIVASCFLVVPSQGFPAPSAALPIVATALILLAGEQGNQPYLWPLTNPASRYVGDISYSLYLWHFPVLILLLAVMPGDNVLYWGVAAALIVGLSVLSYHFVEDPIRKSAWLTPAVLSSRQRRRRRRRRQRFLRKTAPKIGLFAVIGVVALGLVYVAFLRGSEQAPTTEVASTAAPADEATGSVDTGRSCVGAAVLDPASGCAQVDLGATMDPTPADAVDDVMLVSGKSLCWIKTTGDLSWCKYGLRSADSYKVAIVGDSHAQSLLPAFFAGGGSQNWQIDAYVGDGCLLSTRLTEKCGEIQPKILDKVAGGEYDLVITTAARTKGNFPDEFAQAFQRVVDAGSEMVVVADVPAVSEDALLCTQRLDFNPQTSTCATSLSGMRADPLVAAAAAVPAVKLVDLTNFFCVGDSCSAVVGNVPVYRDAGAHMTKTYSQSLGPYLGAAIRQAEPESAPAR
ncbi:acyltransferase family protein [Herbiconiux sp. YIM B11900]|uniref:acyltransferase family protein n=1 Tax=Herbiconiux sp. YIM B11900 TaxID=3404131 RepID=UPI003F86E245